MNPADLYQGATEADREQLYLEVLQWEEDHGGQFPSDAEIQQMADAIAKKKGGSVTPNHESHRLSLTRAKIRTDSLKRA